MVEKKEKRKERGKEKKGEENLKAGQRILTSDVEANVNVAQMP